MSGLWGSVEDQLRKAGVSDARTAVREAMGHGVTAGEVLALLHHWESHKPTWGTGALHYRVRNAAAGEAPDAHWPKADESQVSTGRERAYREQQAEKLRRSVRAAEIIRAGHRAGKTDGQILEELSAEGLSWKD